MANNMEANNYGGSIEKLKNSDSYDMWKFTVMVIFESENLDGIVNGTEKLKQDGSEKEKEEWHKKDAKSRRIILTTVETQPKLHLMTCLTANDMMKKLASIYEFDGQQKKCDLMEEFFGCKYLENEEMSIFLSRIENIVFKLKKTGENISDALIISKIINSLPEKYKYFKTAWDSTADTDKTLVKLIARLLQEDSRKINEIKNEINEQKIFKANERHCFKCKKIGHIARNCRTNMNQNNNKYNGDFKKHSKQYCRICKKNNHSESQCFYKNKTEDKTYDKKFSLFVSDHYNKNNDNFETSNKWIIDSGCTSHMSNTKIDMIETKLLSRNIGLAKKNENMKTKLIGKIETSECILNDVYYVPELTNNLMSVSAITDNGGTVVFKNDKVRIYKSNALVLEGQKSSLNGLYEVEFEKSCKSLITYNDYDILKTWHKKLGHMSYSNMIKLKNLTVGFNIPNNLFKNDFDKCDICIMSNKTREPFVSERTRASRALELIHSDVCGPFQPSTWDGYNYIVTFLDDYTSFTTIKLIKRKSDVFEVFKDFVNESESKWNLKISRLRCDNGGEYNSNVFKNWCRQKGISVEYTVPYTPQLNGRAERLNRTLTEKIRALLNDSKLSKEMWGEAACVATYLINRSPTKTTNKTPAENWYGRKPDLSRLQIFGCDAFAKNLGYLRKLDNRSNKLTFIGYGINCYRLWDKKNRKVIFSRDVTFKNCDDKENDNEYVKNIDLIDRGVDNEINLMIDNNNDEIINENNNNNDVSRNETDTESDDNNKEENEIIQEEEEEIINNDYCNNEIDEELKSDELQTTRSGRKIVKPAYLNDYSMLTYNEVMNSDDKLKWKKAINDEIESLNKNKTWTLENIENIKNKEIFNNKWIFKIKSDGTYKARLVICGYQQKFGIDYTETFSPVVDSNCLRTLLAIATAKNFHIMGFDVKTAFLYGDLKEEIYMKLPEGINESENKVCKLNKSLYGLKQAPMNWNNKFVEYLKLNGLIETKSDRCIFKNDNGSLIMGLYVDDGILIGNNKNEMIMLLENLSKNFEMKIQENLNVYLGMELTKTNDGIKLTQSKYIDQILKKYGMENAKSKDTPISNQNNIEEDNDDINIVKFPYRECIGSLLHASNKTRPDITYAVNYESRFGNKPNTRDVENVKRTLRYLKDREKNGISFKKNSNVNVINAYCDSDYAGDNKTRKSTTGFVIMYCGGPIAWCSRIQSLVALSTTEAEFIAAAECVKIILYLKCLISELISGYVKVNLFMDNQSAMALAKNGVMNKRSKHIDVRYKFLHEKVKNGDIEILYCQTENQIADIFTKALSKTKFEKCVSKIIV